MIKRILGVTISILLLIVPSLSAHAKDTQVCLWETESPLCDDNKTTNGYWWYGFWVPGLPTFETQLGPTPPVTIGNVVIYAPGVMEATAEYRGLSLAGYIGAISTPTCGNIGLDFWLKRPGFDWEGPFLAVDCSRRNDMYGHMMQLNLVAEIDFETAVRWGLARYGGTQNDGRWSFITNSPVADVIVSKYNPEKTPIWNIVRVEDWFPTVVEYDTCGNCEWILYDGDSEWRISGKPYLFTQPLPPFRFLAKIDY